MAKTPGYYDKKDIADLTGLSESWAIKKIKKINDDLEENNLFVIPGSIPQELFHDKFPFIKKVPAATDTTEE